MEVDNNPSTSEDNDNLIYILNTGKIFKGKLVFELKNRGDNALNIISIQDIKYGFQKFLNAKQKERNHEENEEYFDIQTNNICYDYIRYFNGQGWILLGDENSTILIDSVSTLDNLKIMIKATIISDETRYIQKTFDYIDREINSIKTKLNDIKKGNIKYFGNFLNSIILTANPLMDVEKELRTMNDFNIIPANLYSLFKENDYLKFSQFGILTTESFKKALSKESKGPLIIHLICKSTYDISNNDNLDNKESLNFVKLIFEQENNYNCEFIDKVKLDKIFSDPIIKENIKNIILIISTQLSGDVYDIFEKYGFGNIIIQHTTLADLDYIAKFNLRLYENLLFNQGSNLYNICQETFNLVRAESYTSFCCCFHKHKIDCDFMKTLKNEIYNDNQPKKEYVDLRKTIPHFCHLPIRCPSNISKCRFPWDFCRHEYFCLNRFKVEYKTIKKTNTSPSNLHTELTTCCCYHFLQNDQIHSINYVFRNSFSNENIYFSKTKNTKPNMRIKYVPEYEKMFVIVGKNNDVCNIIQGLKGKKYINIYGDTIENLKIFIYSLIEYFRERKYIFESENGQIEHILFEDNNCNIYQSNPNINISYFIYTQFDTAERDIDNSIIKNYKIILFSEKKSNDQKYTSIRVNPEPELKSESKVFIPNGYIKYQKNHHIINIWQKPKKK